MEIIVNAKKFKDAIAALKTVVPKKPTHPLLGCVELKLDSWSIKLTATSLSDWLRVAIAATLKNVPDGEFSALLDFVKIEAFCKAIKVGKKDNDSIVLEVNDNAVQAKFKELSLEVGYSSSKPEHELPAMPKPGNDTKSFSIISKALFPLIKSVVYAVSDDETKQVMTGVKASLFNGKLSLAATDGHRAAIASFSTINDGDFTAVIRGKVWENIILKYFEGTLGFSEFYDGNCQYCEVLGNGIKLVTRCLQGNYPKIETLMGTGDKSKSLLVSDRCSLLERLTAIYSLAKASIKASKDKAVMPLISFEGDKKVRSFGQINGERESFTYGDIDSVNWLGNTRINFDIRYFIELLEVCQNNKVEIWVNPDHLGKIKPQSVIGMCIVKDSNVSHLIMPVELRD